jgi:hypothetical protein
VRLKLQPSSLGNGLKVSLGEDKGWERSWRSPQWGGHIRHCRVSLGVWGNFGIQAGRWEGHRHPPSSSNPRFKPTRCVTSGKLLGLSDPHLGDGGDISSYLLEPF